MSDGSQPSFGELAAALAALNRPTPPEPQGLAKHVGTIMVAAIIGMGAWMTSSIAGVQNTLTAVSTTVTAISKTVGDMQAAQGNTTTEIGNIKAQNAGLMQRVQTLETGATRMNERMRIVEGQKPLESRAGP